MCSQICSMEFVTKLVPGRIRKNKTRIRELALTVQRRWNRNSNTAHDGGDLNLFDPETHSRTYIAPSWAECDDKGRH